MKRALALLFALSTVFSPARRVAKRGVSEFRAKKFAEAKRDFREAAAREPAEKTWNFNLGTAHAAAGDLPEARAQLVQATRSKDPAVSAKAFYQLGTLDLQENGAAAADELRRSLELQPADPGKKDKPSSARQPGRGPEDSEFQKRAGMTRAEAEAMLRSLESEQKQRERVSARQEGKDW